MTDIYMRGISQESQILPRRLGAFLKRQGSAKQLALKLDIDLRTMNNLRGGLTWPIARHWLNLWLEFGDDFLEAVHHPERTEARLIREAEARERARQQRIASTLVESRPVRMAPGLGETDGWDEDPAEIGPPNLDLFEGHP